MNALYDLRAFMSARRRAPHVASLSADRARILARAERKQASAVRAQRYSGRLARAAAWLRHHRRQISERAAIAIGSAALTWFIGAQPVIDQQAADNAKLTSERDAMQATATRMAQSQLTINLTGDRNDVRKHVRAIAELEK